MKKTILMLLVVISSTNIFATDEEFMVHKRDTRSVTLFYFLGEQLRNNVNSI